MTASAQRNIPVGRFEISDAADRMVRATSGAAPGDGIVAHPIFVFLAAVGGLGIRVGDVLAMAGGTIERGAVLAACAIRIHRPLRVGTTYIVIGHIVDVHRKPSRRFGQADHFLLRITLTDVGIDHADVELQIIVPADNAQEISR